MQLTDASGFWTNLDGTRSPLIHQYDRLGPPFDQWLDGALTRAEEAYLAIIANHKR